MDEVFICPGAKVLYLGAASGTSVSHVADIGIHSSLCYRIAVLIAMLSEVGDGGTVYAVEFSHRSGRDLISMATKRTNVVPIIEDARHPLRYRMLVPMVDVIFADIAQPDQARIVGLVSHINQLSHFAIFADCQQNAHLYLKVGGGVLISIKANCIDSTAPAEKVFASEVQKLREERIRPLEQLTLEPFERDHCMLAGRYIRS